MKIRLLLLLFLIPLAGYTQIVGKVVSVADGDTFTILLNNKQIRIRLHGIDCPEKNQDFGQVAKEFTSSIVFGKVVTVKEMDTDRYGRTIGMVSINGINLNEKLLEAGLAWHYTAFDKNPKWSSLENTARKQKKGLWQKSDALPPWEYRRKKTF